MFPFVRFAAFALTLLPAAAIAGSGTPDPRFGVDGVHVVDLPGFVDDAYALGLAPGGGYLVLAGNETQGNGFPITVHRIDDDGIGHGESPNTGAGFVDAAVVADDGRVLRARQRFSGPLAGVMLNRMLPDGSVDASFGGGDGWIEMYVDGLDLRATALWMDGTGRIVVGGDAYPDGETALAAKDSFVAVFQADGSLDAGFGVGGMVVYPQSANGENVYAVMRDAQDRVLLCGSALVGGDNAATLVRFLPDGDADPGFGLVGLVMLDTPNAADDSCQAIVQHAAEGALFMAMHRRFGNPTQQAKRVYRVEDDGSYSANPPEFMSGEASSSLHTRMLVDGDGRLVVAGVAMSASRPDLFVARLTAELLPDTAFSGSGNRRYPLTHEGSAQQAVRVVGLVEDAGRLVIATQYRDSNPATMWSVLRLQGDALFGDGFE